MLARLNAGFKSARAPGGLLCPAEPTSMAFRRDVWGVAWVVALTTAIFFASFYEALFTGNIEALMAKGDSHLLNWSKAYFLDVRLREGEFPLWDPMLLSGTAYVAHPLSMAFYPPNLIRALIVRAGTPETFAYSMYGLILFHFIVGSVGMYLWTRCAGVSIRSSIVVALAVSLCERWIFNSIAQTPIICGGAWAPLVFVALRQAVHGMNPRRQTGWALLAGVAYGFQILAGWPQLAIYCTYAYVAYVVLAEIGRSGLWRPSTWRMALRGAVRVIAICAAFGITGAMIGSALIAPAKQLIDESSRSREHFREYEVKTMLNVPPPLFFVRHFSKTEPWTMARGREIMAAVQASISLVSPLFAVSVISLLFLSHYRVFIHLALAYLLFDLTYGPPLPLSRLSNEIAPFAMSTPWYQAMLVSIPFGVLSGFAIDKLVSLGRAGRLPWLYLTILVLTGSILVLFGLDPLISDKRWSAGDAILPAAVLALILFGTTLRHWPALITVALVFEIGHCTRDQAVFATRGWGVFMIPLPDDLGDLTAVPDPDIRRGRIVCLSCNDHVWLLERAINGYDPLVLHRTVLALTPPGKRLEYLRHGSAEGNLRALTLLRRTFWLVPAFVRGPMPQVDRAFPPTAVAYLDTDGPLDLEELSSGETPWGTIAEPSVTKELWTSGGRQDVTRAWMTGVEIPPRNSALLIRYSSTADLEMDVKMKGESPQQRFDTGRIPVRAAADGTIEVPLPDFESADVLVDLVLASSEVQAQILRIDLIEDLADEIDRIEVKVSKANVVRAVLRDLPSPRALVFTETNYPGWTATVDGERATVVTANGINQAVIVPAGTHEVEFAFRPRLVYAGIAISATALLFSLGAATYLFMPRLRSAMPRNGQ